MKRSNRLVILVGVLLAVLAFVAIVILLNQRAPEVAPEEVTQTVLVATEDIDIGEEITPAKVEETDIDPEAIQGTPLTSATQVSGQPALFAIPEGSQVTGEAIGIGNEIAVNLPALLQPGEKAIAFEVDRATGLDFLVKAGDTIDVVFGGQVDVVQETADSASNPDPEAPPRFESAVGLEDQRTVKAVLQDKRVLYVSASRATQPELVDSNGDGVIDDQDVQPENIIESVIIVFAGTAQDAELIKFAQRDLTERGALTAIVRNAEDDAIETTIGITFDQMVEVYGVRIPDIVEQLTEEAAPVP